MTFIFRKDKHQDSIVESRRAWEAYRAYLESIKTSLPEGARAFAFEDWHYNTADPRCLHDSWLESLVFREDSEPGGSNLHRLTLILTLIGPFHDRRIQLTYTDVTSYSMNSVRTVSTGHGDWLYDEVRLSGGGRALHEIEWSEGPNWLIEFGDLAWVHSNT